jgi:cyclase
MLFWREENGGIMKKIKNNIYVETDFLGCNPSFIVTANGIIMIDTPQKPCEAFRWKKEIEKYGDVVYIINTDHHRDHAIGNYFFSGDIIMHEGTMKKLLEEDRLEVYKDWVRLLDPHAESFIDNYFVRKPKFTYKDKMNIYLGGEIFELIHVTSHTQDETLVYLPQDKVLFTGDTVCTNGIPSLYESYPKEWLEALKVVEELDFEVVVPGHGKIGNKHSVSQFRQELGKLIEKAQELIEKGFTRDAVIKEIVYDDSVHIKYPAQFKESFGHMMKENKGRLFDTLIKKSPGPSKVIPI